MHPAPCPLSLQSNVLVFLGLRRMLAGTEDDEREILQVRFPNLTALLAAGVSGT